MDLVNDWRPGADAGMLVRRARLLADIRAFFAERGVLEVTTPVLGRYGVTDVHLASMTTRDTPPRYLRTSPELAHKRLLAAGLGDLYELGPAFRGGEAGRWHNPEFTLLEWYRTGWSDTGLAAETVALIRAAGLADWPSETITWRELAVQHLGFDPLGADTADLRATAPDAPANLDRAGLLDWLASFRIQPGLPAGTLTVVTGYPAEQAALARLDPDDPAVARRFEVFAGDVELANGYLELTDGDTQRERFAHDNHRRAAAGLDPVTPDARFLQALDQGLPACAGVALGVDRLLAVITDTTDLDQVQAFSWSRS